MENLRHSAANGGEDTDDLLYLSTKEESFPIPMKYIDATRTTCTSLDVVLEKILQRPESGWRKRIIRCMDGLHKIHFTERKATRRIHMARVETDEETNNLSSRQCMARYVETYV